jgi:hypothetical protein
MGFTSRLKLTVLAPCTLETETSSAAAIDHASVLRDMTQRLTIDRSTQE